MIELLAALLVVAVVVGLMVDSYAEQLARLCRLCGLPEPVREHRFLPDRKFRFDLAWPEEKLAVEIHGGRWIYGRHQRPLGFQRDVEKHNLALLSGWRVLIVLPEMIADGRALDLIERALSGAGPP